MGTIRLRSIIRQLAFGLVFISPLALSQQRSAPVDSTLVAMADFTGNGIADTVSFHVIADSLWSPFSWTLAISSSGRSIFLGAENDSSFDRFFADKGFVGNCTGYADCKKHWYFTDFLRLLLVSPDDSSFASEKLSEMQVDQFATPYLIDSCMLSSADAKLIVREIFSKLTPRRITLITYPPYPASSGPVWMYVPRLARFVPIWNE
jgi:hypothetical protein